MRSFRDLKVWSKAHELTLLVYSATSPFLKEELYGLTSQLRRAASSIPANIAEGCGRGSTADFVRFLHIASGSACELEYQLLLARELRLLNGSDYVKLSQSVTEVKRMLSSFTHRLIADS